MTDSGADYAKRVYQRPLWPPIAMVIGFLAFFAVYLTVASALGYLFPPEPGGPTVFESDMEMPADMMLYAAAGMLVALPSGMTVYDTLRGEQPKEAAKRYVKMILTTLVAVVVWIGGLAVAMLVSGLGGLFEALGLLLFGGWLIVSLVVFLGMYQRNTPPYTDGEDAVGGENGG